jgi:NDP-sugar pyrophosphorylase family protein
MDRTIIGDSANVRDSIIGRHVKLLSSKNKNTEIHSTSVVADDVAIAEGCKLEAAKIYPHQFIRGEFSKQTIFPG